MGANSNSRLKDWLDPNDATGAFVWNGIDACPKGMVVNLNLNNTISSGTTTYQATNSIESTSVIQSGATVKYEAGNSIVLKPGFHAEAGSNFQASIKSFDCVAVPNPINLVAWTNFACIDDGLQIPWKILKFPLLFKKCLMINLTFLFIPIPMMEILPYNYCKWKR